jgi:hypothetical protein
MPDRVARALAEHQIGVLLQHCYSRWSAKVSMREGVAGVRPGLDSVAAGKLDKQLSTKEKACAKQIGYRVLQANASFASLKDFLAQID